MTNLISLADCLITTCIRVLAERHAIKLPHEVMAQIISSCDGLEEELLDNYSPMTESLDTYTREWLLDAVGKHFAGRSWPVNMEPDDGGAFIKKVADGVLAEGGEIVKEPQ